MLRRLCLALSLLPLPALAQITSDQVTSDQAASLQDQVRAWVVNLLGPDFPLPAPRLEVSPAGDHYQLSLRLGSAPDSAQVTAILRGPDGGRWTLSDIRYPPTFRYTLDLGQAAGGNVAYDITTRGQTGQWVIDPSLQTESTVTTGFTGIDAHASSDLIDQSMHYGAGASQGSVRPAGNGRVTMETDGHLEGVTMDFKPSARRPPGQTVPPPFAMEIAQGRVHVTADDVDPVQLMQTLHLFGTVLKYGNDPATKTEAGAAGLAMLVSLGNLGRGFTIDESLEGFHVVTPSATVELQRTRFSFGVIGESDLVELSLQFGAEGLKLPAVPLGDAASLIPSRFEMRPSVKNVPGPALLGLLDSRTGGPAAQRRAALFARGPIVAGLDDVLVEIAGAQLTGHATVSIASPASLTGSGEFAMTNLDSLQQRVATVPGASQALPALVFLKGIGKADGTRTVWNLDLHDNRLFVNGTDMMALAGAGARPDRGTRPPRDPSPARP